MFPPSRAHGARRWAAGAVLGCALAAVPLVHAGAEEPGASIAHVEIDGKQLHVLVSVPAGAEVDLAGTTASVGGSDATARAERATGTTSVRRTAVIAIDTSNSMRGDRAAAARQAAMTYLETVPEDVYVGVVTFDGTVETPLEPTLDRDAARSVVEGLTLGLGTRLYEGVQAAVAASGKEGQRTVLVLSDGADTTSTTLEDVTSALAKEDVLLDVVTLEGQTPSLAALSAAAGGSVISATPEALEAAFTREADVLSRQVLVTVDVPADVSGTEADLSVTLPTATTPLTASAYTTVRDKQPASPPTVSVGAVETAKSLPSWVLYAGVAAVGLALMMLLLVLVPAKAKPLGAAERLEAYLGSGTGSDEVARPTEALAPVKKAATKMLSRNRGLEERISLRLEGAGSELRPPEWLLVHAGLAVAFTVLGLLLSGGSILLGLLALVLGIFGPWVYLGFKRGRRRKAFNAALPDALQLMAGALEAGLSLPQATDTIVKEGLEPVSSEFRRVLVETRLGVDLEDAMDGVAERLESEDLGWVVMAIRIQRPIGGNLAELLATVAATMREREYMRRQVAALAAEGKLSAYVLGGLPPLFLFYLLLTQRDYVMPLFTEPMGLVMLGGAGLLLGVGIFWMSKLIKVEV